MFSNLGVWEEKTCPRSFLMDSDEERLYGVSVGTGVWIFGPKGEL